MASSQFCKGGSALWRGTSSVARSAPAFGQPAARGRFGLRSWRAAPLGRVGLEVGSGVSCAWLVGGYALPPTARTSCLGQPPTRHDLARQTSGTTAGPPTPGRARQRRTPAMQAEAAPGYERRPLRRRKRGYRGCARRHYCDTILRPEQGRSCVVASILRCIGRSAAATVACWNAGLVRFSFVARFRALSDREIAGS